MKNSTKVFVTALLLEIFTFTLIWTGFGWRAGVAAITWGIAIVLRENAYLFDKSP